MGCGRGRVATRLAELYPNNRSTGIDLSHETIEYARNEAYGRDINSIEFKAADPSDFDNSAKPESFDFVTTFDAIHDQTRPLNVLKGIHRALKYVVMK